MNLYPHNITLLINLGGWDETEITTNISNIIDVGNSKFPHLT